VVAIEQAAAETGLPLNRTKREIIMKDFSKISMRNTFQDFIKVEREEMSCLVHLSQKARHIMQKTDELQKAMKRLVLLHSQDALVLLKNSLAMLYLLRTSNCSVSPLLADFDKILRTGLCTILNVDLTEDQ